MFLLEPPFKIIRYAPIMAAFGGVEYDFERPYNLRSLTNEISNVVESIGTSLERAYKVKTIVEQPQVNLLSTRVTPIESILNKREVDLDLNYSNLNLLKKIKIVCKKMLIEKKDNAILTKSSNNGLYFFHVLKENFDPVSTGDLLKATKSVLLRIAGQKLEARTEIVPDYLEVDVKIKKRQNYIV